jgi:uncharacterized protein (UPF0548 family)
MLLLRRPTDDQIRAFLARQAGEPFSYDFVGCTLDEPEQRRGWNIDRHRVLLGHGEQVFGKACEAITSWQMFPQEITTLWQAEPPRDGLAVAVLYRAAPLVLWMLMAARVINVIRETARRDGSAVECFGFAYGTLPNHPERGEERFLVEWERKDDSIWYEVLAVSQPRHWLARLGYPYTRYEQARFRRLSCAAMQRAVISRP